MPSASDSAYPRLKANPTATELGEIYTPNIFELMFAAESTRKPALQVGLLLLLKTFQRLGYFVRYAEFSLLPKPDRSTCPLLTTCPTPPRGCFASTTDSP